MKICVFSDSHGKLGQMIDAMEKEHPDRVFFLGDNFRDGEALASAYPEVPIDMVRGNCDFCSGPDEILIEAGGVRFFLTHGHKQYVKSTTRYLVDIAKKRNVDMVCYGHTHQGMNQPVDGIWLFNPGTIGGIYNRSGYGVLTVEDGRVRGDLR